MLLLTRFTIWTRYCKKISLRVIVITVTSMLEILDIYSSKLARSFLPDRRSLWTNLVTIRDPEFKHST